MSDDRTMTRKRIRLSGPSLRPIADKLHQIETRERAERRDLLRDHHAKFRAEISLLSEECVAAGGHEWVALPANGINAPHFFTGEWPMRCGWCGTDRPTQPPDQTAV